jgi:hypothetical protein
LIHPAAATTSARPPRHRQSTRAAATRRRRILTIEDGRAGCDANTAGTDIVSYPRDVILAKRLVAESGDAGEKVVLMTLTDFPGERALGGVAADLFTRLGLNVDAINLDRGAIESRRASREPVERGDGVRHA